MGSEIIDLGSSSLYISSSLIPNNYFWKRDANGNVLGNLIVSGTAYHSTKASIAVSSIPVNTIATMSGQYYITKDITIGSGKTLVISPGATVTFGRDSKLTINGRLVANGTSSQRIQMGNGNWQGIRFMNASNNSSINYCEINMATNGIYVDNTDINVKNSHIHNNSYSGIQAVNGAYVFGQYNTIEGSSYGLKANNNSDIYLGGYYIRGGNRIFDNDVNLWSMYGSYVFTGRSDWIPCDNSVYSPSGFYNGLAYFGGIIKAQRTWWGTPNPSNSSFFSYNGTIDYSIHRTSDPGYGSP